MSVIDPRFNSKPLVMGMFRLSQSMLLPQGICLPALAPTRSDACDKALPLLAPRGHEYCASGRAPETLTTAVIISITSYPKHPSALFGAHSRYVIDTICWFNPLELTSIIVKYLIFLPRQARPVPYLTNGAWHRLSLLPTYF
jgi:hypothetical protein